MRIIVSGKTYDAALDPLATEVPGEIGLPEPDRRRAGRGYRYTYDIGTGTMLADLLDHLETVGSTFVGGDDDMTRAEGRAILRDVKRIRGVFEAGSVGVLTLGVLALAALAVVALVSYVMAAMHAAVAGGLS